MRVVQEHGKLLDATNCSRCNDPLVLRTVSHFTSEPICKGCMDAEAVIKMAVMRQGVEEEFFVEVISNLYQEGELWKGTAKDE